MRWFVVFSAFAVFPAFSNAASSEKFELCYFDMSGVPDSKFLEDNLRNSYGVKKDEAPLHIHVTKKGENINESFKEWVSGMIKEDKKNCDGLVFSGYHTGGHFHQEKGDTRGDKNKLNLTLVEKLSCDPKYKPWFENVKQIWLFGSFTITDETVKKEKLSQTGNRLAAPVTDSDDELTMRRLNLSFAHAMDRGAPLSSRWMRSFPNTHIYGWSNEAPTSHQIKAQKNTNKDGWGGTHPIFEHIKQIGQAEKSREANNKKKTVDKATIVKGIEALSQGDYCDKPWESIVSDGKGVKGVRQNRYGKTKKLGCDLINAQQMMDLMRMKKYPKSLSTLTWCDNIFAKDEKNRKACLKSPEQFINPVIKASCENLYPKEKAKCIKDPALFSKNKTLSALEQINKTEEELAEARKILESDTANEREKLQATQSVRDIVGEAHINDSAITVSHLLFNEIDSSYLTARKTLEENDPFFKDIKKILPVNSPVMKALKEKTKSSALSTTRKVDYIEFYKALHPEEDTFVYESVQSIIDKELKCAYWKPKTNGGCPKPVTGAGNSLLGAGRGYDAITPGHHYTLTAVVSDQLKQYDLLTAEQANTLTNTLRKVPKESSNDYIKTVADCLTSEDFHNCKN